MAHSTNYLDTFIGVAPDSKAEAAQKPPPRKVPSVAARTFEMIFEHPYRYTSDDVIFTVYADRKEIAKGKRAAARETFFSKGQPCMRCSDLAKRYGWGIHADERGRVALYAVESRDYQAFMNGKRKAKNGALVTIKRAMRSRR